MESMDYNYFASAPQSYQYMGYSELLPQVGNDAMGVTPVCSVSALATNPILSKLCRAWSLTQMAFLSETSITTSTHLSARMLLLRRCRPAQPLLPHKHIQECPTDR